MIYVRTFKGYEDKTQELDKNVNDWINEHQVKVVTIKTTLSHEIESRARSGDLLYTVLYESDQPIPEGRP